MSWNKETINFSEIDSIIKTLEDTNTPYQLEILGEVGGYGLSDVSFLKNISKKYPIRCLRYMHIVIKEQMIRTKDCDTDDYIVSKRFLNLEEPLDWPLEKEE